jgi:hypothetical protein
MAHKINQWAKRYRGSRHDGIVPYRRTGGCLRQAARPRRGAGPVPWWGGDHSRPEPSRAPSLCFGVTRARLRRPLTAPGSAAAVELRSRNAEHGRQRTTANPAGPALSFQHANLLIDCCPDEHHRLKPLEPRPAFTLLSRHPITPGNAEQYGRPAHIGSNARPGTRSTDGLEAHRTSTRP